MADASGTLLFDVKNRHVAQGADVDPGHRPPISCRARSKARRSPARCRADRGQATGLPEGIPGGRGRRRPGGGRRRQRASCGRGVISSTVGTSGVVFAFADESALDPQGRVHTFCHSVPGKWHVMGVMLSAGGSLRWFRDALCQAEKSRGGGITGRDPYEYITEAAETAPLGCEGLIFLPYLTGERTPHNDPYRAGRVHRPDAAPHDSAHMARVGAGRRGVRHARQSRDHARDGRAGRAGARVRRRGAQPVLAADPGRREQRARSCSSTWTKARRTARRCWRRSPRACTGASKKRATPPSASSTPAQPDCGPGRQVRPVVREYQQCLPRARAGV